VAVANYRFPGWPPLRFIIAAAVALIAFMAIILGFGQKWLWVRQVGYDGVFWTLGAVRRELFAAAFVVALLYLARNLMLAQRNGAAFSTSGKLRNPTIAAKLGIEVSPKVLTLTTAAISAAAALVFAAIFHTQWDTLLRFRYGGSSGASAPLYGVDGGFDLFRLPFYELLQNSLTAVACVTLSIVTASYAYCGFIQRPDEDESDGRTSRAAPAPSVARQFGSERTEARARISARSDIQTSSPVPLGTQAIGGGVNFASFSMKSLEDVTVCPGTRNKGAR
jgi:uncharacterized membrane protein (UPF0182 family)